MRLPILLGSNQMVNNEMRIAIKPFTILLIAVWATAVGAEATKFEGQVVGNYLHLRANARFHHELAGNYLDVTITNGGSRAACVSDRAFNRLNAFTDIWDSRGRGLPRLAVGYPRIDYFHGVDVGDDYKFLFPGKVLNVSVPLENFMINRGAYRYRMIVFYYICHDTVELERLVPREDLNPSSVTIEGRFALP